jgi:hypothetical protein
MLQALPLYRLPIKSLDWDVASELELTACQAGQMATISSVWWKMPTWTCWQISLKCRMTPISRCTFRRISPKT